MAFRVICGGTLALIVGCIVLSFVYMVYATFLVTLVHETGHALAALLLTDQNITIIMIPFRQRHQPDFARSARGLRIGRLTLIWRFKFLDGVLGLCLLPNSTAISRFRRGCFFLGGPLASLLLTLVVATPCFRIADPIIRGFALWMACFMPFGQFLFSILPWQAPGWLPAYVRGSDGLKILRLIRN